MSADRMVPPAEPLFLNTPSGNRFCLYHAPANIGECRGAIVYVHPFGEEMNMSRRMAAMQARAFAAIGFAVLQIDLYGCGDSDGELRDATWEIWKQDLFHAMNWVRNRASPNVILWGLRLGATLALDMARNADLSVDRCVIWQPVIAGRPFTTQFLRMRMAGEMMAGDAQETGGTQALRDALMRGNMIEVGGYEWTRELVGGIDRIDLSCLDSLPCPVYWLELIPNEHAAMPAARMGIVQAWKRQNIQVRLQSISGPAFWATREVCECSALISATASLFEEMTA